MIGPKRAVIVLILAILLPGCGYFAKTSPLQRAIVLCTAYDATLRSMAAMKAAGKLSPGQIKGVDEARLILNPICIGPPPTELTTRAVLDRAEAALFLMIQAEKEAKK